MKLAVKYISFPPVKRFVRAAGRAWSRLRRISMQYGNWVLGFPSPGCPIIAPILSRKRGDEAIFAPISNFLSELKKRKTTVVLQETSKSRDVLQGERFQAQLTWTFGNLQISRLEYLLLKSVPRRRRANKALTPPCWESSMAPGTPARNPQAKPLKKTFFAQKYDHRLFPFQSWLLIKNVSLSLRKTPIFFLPRAESSWLDSFIPLREFSPWWCRFLRVIFTSFREKISLCS